MNDGTITNMFVEAGKSNNISVSGNDVEVSPETPPQDETEIEAPVEENTETVSGNDSGSDGGSDDVSFNESVSGNNVYVPYDDSGLVTQIETMTTEIGVLNSSIQELHITVIGISSLLTMLLGFTLFKWAEQKIKRFTKGVFSKYE